MHYRLATMDDLTEICNMIEAAKQLMSEQGIEQFADELQKFKNEVLEADKDNEDQFAGCMR
ncbi:hypothetical protein [Butyrivibrio sp. AE2032]|uniref:hypothetical protein n=1 Tax=Butyrivibrio sp. AE2032 TaxID=1458463 RepID=UPI000551D355|nr:hypothetical protein [Butyrivibrio sp. AE2032]